MSDLAVGALLNVSDPLFGSGRILLRLVLLVGNLASFTRANVRDSALGLRPRPFDLLIESCRPLRRSVPHLVPFRLSRLG